MSSALIDELDDEYEPEDDQHEEEDLGEVAEVDLVEDEQKDTKKAIRIEGATEAEKQSLVLNTFQRAVLRAKRRAQLMNINVNLREKPIPADIEAILPQLFYEEDDIIPPEILFETKSLDDIIEREIYERSIPLIVVVDFGGGVHKHYKITDFRYDATLRGDDYFKRRDLFPGRS